MNYRAFLIHDPKVDHRIHLDGDVVLRDDVLRRHVHRNGSQADTKHPIDEGDNDDDTGPITPDEPTGQSAPSKDDGPFVLPENVKSQQNQDHGKDRECKRDEHHDRASFGLERGFTRRRKPSTPVTSASSPG